MVKILITFIVIILVAWIAWFLFTQQDDNTNSSQQDPTITSTPTITEEEEQASLPDGWSRAYDSTFSVQFAYPSDFDLKATTSDIGETAIYSFDVDAAPGQGGVPSDEIKIGITYFPQDGQRRVSFENEDVISSESITVDGRQAIRRVTEGQAGGSVTTSIDVNGNTYLISAYPPNSEQLEIYNQFLNFVRLEVSPPVTITNVSPGETVNFPLIIEGQAPGTWFFEGVLPISIQTVDGEEIARVNATSPESWMTTATIPFNATFESALSQSNNAFILIEKNNPSGLPRNSYSVYLPIEL